MELYAAQALGFSPNRTSQFLKLARDLDHLPPLKEAMAAGRLEWIKAQQVARVASPRTIAQWVDAAQGISRRELAKKAGLVPATATREEAILAALGGLLEGGCGMGGNGGSDSGIDSGGERCVLRRHKATNPYKVVLYRCDACKQTEVVTGSGRRPVDPAAAAAALENAEISDQARSGSRSRSAIAPGLRRQVLICDGHRCRAPGCRSTRFLEIHHRVARAHGGTERLDNLINPVQPVPPVRAPAPAGGRDGVRRGPAQCIVRRATARDGGTQRVSLRSESTPQVIVRGRLAAKGEPCKLRQRSRDRFPGRDAHQAAGFT